MAFVSDFGLFLCFPDNSLMIVSWGDEICCIEMVNIQNFIVMLIESFHQTLLRHIPLFKGQVFAYTAKNIWIDAKLYPVDCASVALESADTIFSPHIPKLDKRVLSSSCDDIVVRSV